MSIFRRTTPPTGRTLAQTISTMYADDSHAGRQDELDRGRLAQQLSRSIADLADQTTSAVVGLVGPWGSGKTTIVDDIQEVLAGKGWYIATHNPWEFSDYTSAVSGFFATLRDAVPTDVLGRAWRADLGGWVSRIAPLGAVGTAAGVDASAPLGVVGALVSGDQSPGRLREKAAEGLTKLEHPVLMVLDDLDRLSPDELLYTFKLVRLLGRLPNVYYLLAYDEQTLIDLLGATTLIGEGSGRAQQYMEKMIQVRLEIPPLLPEQRSKLADAAINEICVRHQLTIGVDANRRLSKAWAVCLSQYLDQPRAIKRLFTQVDVLWPDVADEVDFVDFILVVFLRTFEHPVLDLVLECREELLQTGLTWSLSQSKETPSDRWKRWLELLEKVRCKDPSRMASLLADMFLPLRGARDGTNYSRSYMEAISARYGVGSPEHFDRYFQIGVPESDLSEVVVINAAKELRAGMPGPALAALEHHMESDMTPALRKLIRVNEANPIQASSLIGFLGPKYEAAIDQSVGLFAPSPNFAITALITASLDTETPDVAAKALIDAAEASSSSLELAADLIRLREGDKSKDQAWATSASATVSERLGQHIDGSADSPIQLATHLSRLIGSYRGLAGVEQVRGLLWSILQSGRWDLENLLGALVPIGQASSGTESWTSMGELSMEAIDDLLGVDRVLAAIPPKPELLSAERPYDYWDRPIEPTDGDALVERALFCLERIRSTHQADNAQSQDPGGVVEAGPDPES